MRLRSDAPIITRAAYIVSIFAVVLLSGSAYGHDASTHRNITRQAIRYLLVHQPQLGCALRLEEVLQVGAVQEDQIPRYMFHFYPALNDWVEYTAKQYHVSSSCNSLQWATMSDSDPPCRQEGGLFPSHRTQEVNIHTWGIAIEKTASGGCEELGFVVHLLEDLASPAHVRSDAHPPWIDPDPFEQHTAGRIPRIPSTTSGIQRFQDVREAFDSLQHFTQSRFFSNDTVFCPTLAGPTVDLRDPRNKTALGYFYDPDGRRIAHKGMRYHLTGDPKDADIDRTIALEQFDELGPVAVRYAASLIYHYIRTVQPVLAGCQASGSTSR